MASSFALIALFSLALFTSITEARKGPGAYWQAVPRDQSGQETIRHLLLADVSLSEEKGDCNMSNDYKKTSVKEFEPRPLLGAAHRDDAKLKEEKIFTKDFKPRPNLSSYNDNQEEKTFMKDFEPRPNLSSYNNNQEEKTFKKDFEPRPNISSNNNDKTAGAKQEKAFDKDFEPRPNLSSYQE